MLASCRSHATTPRLRRLSSPWVVIQDRVLPIIKMQIVVEMRVGFDRFFFDGCDARELVAHLQLEVTSIIQVAQHATFALTEEGFIYYTSKVVADFDETM